MGFLIEFNNIFIIIITYKKKKKITIVGSIIIHRVQFG